MLLHSLFGFLSLTPLSRVLVEILISGWINIFCFYFAGLWPTWISLADHFTYLCCPLNVVTWWFPSSGFNSSLQLVDLSCWGLCLYGLAELLVDLFSEGHQASRGGLCCLLRHGASHDLPYEDSVVSRWWWSVGGSHRVLGWSCDCAMTRLEFLHNILV